MCLPVPEPRVPLTFICLHLGLWVKGTHIELGSDANRLSMFGFGLPHH